MNKRQIRNDGRGEKTVLAVTSPRRSKTGNTRLRFFSLKKRKKDRNDKNANNK